MYQFEIITNTRSFWRKQRYHWRIKSKGRIIATSETYHNYDDCLATCQNLAIKIKGATVKDIVL